ncbi:Ku protein [Aquihabitans sp. McL0605]|uniref:non-homologous end joining protein Ku n=1 Tax=Aquihabitans sp. McL0605 TaxID=3415671 RepID=UPI003CE9A730
MARPTWTGVVSFGLVSVPVKAYTATRDKDVRFHRIERGSGARIKQQNLSAATGEPVEDDDIVMGYELAPGRHVTFEREEVAALRPDSTKAITVLDFVDLDEVDPVYFDKTYWLGPDGPAAAEPYDLLLEAMEQRNRVAIGHVVMRNKGRLAAIRPMGGLLAMSTMRYADEVISRDDIDELPEDRPEADQRAVDLALQVVDTMTAEWDPEQYPNTYTAELLQAIEARSDGVVAEPEAGEEGEAPVIDLMAALRESVAAAKEKAAAEAGDAGAAKAKPAKKAAKKTG